MFKSIWLIMKKECSRFVKDYRMILMVMVLPALLMYGMYTLMGSGLSEMYEVDEDYRYQCYVQNAPQIYEPIFEAMNFEVIDTQNPEDAKACVAQKDADLVVLFPEDFDNALMKPTDGAVPNIQVFYNYDSTTSFNAYSMFREVTEELETSMVNVLDVNRDVENPDLAEGSSIIMSMMPMLILMLLCTSCASLAPESIAGEKERGTFATLLVTPVNRTAIAIGKIVSLSLFAVLAGLSNFGGMMLGMRNMVADESVSFIPDYSVVEYVWLLVLVVSAVLMLISVVSVVSAFAKTVKEAASTAGMITAVGSLGGLITMFGVGSSGLGWRCIPVLGTAISLNDLLLMEYSVTDIAATCAVNLAIMAVLVVVLSKMFNSEKVMFNK